MKPSFKARAHSKNDPRSKILINPSALEDWELLAILFRSGIKNKNVEILSKELLLKFSSIYELFDTSSTVLLKQSGIGKAKVTSLLATRELIQRIKLNHLKTAKKNSKEDIMELIYFKSSKEVRECFYLITLDDDKNLINLECIAKGGLNEVGIYLRDLVKMVLDDGSKHVIISHNHPKQNAIPSDSDLDLFFNLKNLLSKLEVELIDQWVSGIDGIYSCSENKYIFKK